MHRRGVQNVTYVDDHGIAHHVTRIEKMSGQIARVTGPCVLARKPLPWPWITVRIERLHRDREVDCMACIAACPDEGA